MSITWNGVSSDTIGVVVERIPNRYVPTRRFSPQQVAGRNGNILLVDRSFPNVEQEYEVYLSAEAQGLPSVARACAEWLMGPDGYCRLEDSYDTTVYREAFLMGGYDLENILNKFGRCTITFSCKPQKYLITEETLVAHNPEIYSGAIANFTATADDAISSLTASITPVQSFNGYGRPWAAGAGDNKAYWPTLSKTSQNGLDYAVTDDGNTLTFYGTATSASSGAYSVPSYSDLPLGPFPAGKYTIIATGFVGQNTNDRITINAKYSNGSNVSIANTRISGASGAIPDGTGRALTFTATDEFKFSYYIYIASGTHIDCSVKVKFVEGDTLGEWTPYANVCPITGWTGANIYVSPTQDQQDATVYNVDWTSEAGTTYAGSYEAVSGKLKARPQYASYNGETLVGPWISSMDVYAEGTTPTTGAQVVDLGGAETEYTLTGQTVSPIVGQNYVWADTGEVSVAVYGHITASTTNPTPFDARPIITVSGVGTLTINGYDIEILESVSDFTINCETMEADDNKKISCLEFPVLSGGSNTVTCDAGITSLTMVPRWWTL